ARGRLYARALADADRRRPWRRERGARAARRACGRAPAGHAHRALLPRRTRGRDHARLRDARAERHLLLPTFEQGLLPRRRPDRSARAPRLLGRRATPLAWESSEAPVTMRA